MIKEKIKTAMASLLLGHKKVEKPVSLLIVLWLVALLVMGGINKYIEKEEEPMQNFKEETKEQVITNENE